MTGRMLLLLLQSGVLAATYNRIIPAIPAFFYIKMQKMQKITMPPDGKLPLPVCHTVFDPVWKKRYSRPRPLWAAQREVFRKMSGAAYIC